MPRVTNELKSGEGQLIEGNKIHTTHEIDRLTVHVTTYFNCQRSYKEALAEAALEKFSRRRF